MALNFANLHTIRNGPVVEEPCDRDVLFGRGTGPRRHPGNIVFRSMVMLHVSTFIKLPRMKRRRIAESIVRAHGELGGRFLNRTQHDEGWFVADLEQCVVKTQQALREGHAKWLDEAQGTSKSGWGKWGTKGPNREEPTPMEAVAEINMTSFSAEWLDRIGEIDARVISACSGDEGGRIVVEENSIDSSGKKGVRGNPESAKFSRLGAAINDDNEDLYSIRYATGESLSEQVDQAIQAADESARTSLKKSNERLQDGSPSEPLNTSLNVGRRCKLRQIEIEEDTIDSLNKLSRSDHVDGDFTTWTTQEPITNGTKRIHHAASRTKEEIRVENTLDRLLGGLSATSSNFEITDCLEALIGVFEKDDQAHSQLLVAGGVETIVNRMELFHFVDDVQVAGFSVLSRLAASENASMQQEICRVNGPAIVVAAMRAFEDNEDLQANGCAILMRLLTGGGNRRRLMIVSAGSVGAVINAVRRHRDSGDVCSRALRFLHELSCWSCRANEWAMTRCDGVRVVVEAIRIRMKKVIRSNSMNSCHSQSAAVVTVLGLALLCNLCRNSRNRKEIFSSGVGSLVVEVVHQHNADKNLRLWARRLLDWTGA